MLDQLVESKSNSAENTRRSGFLGNGFCADEHGFDKRRGSIAFSQRIMEWEEAIWSFRLSWRRFRLRTSRRQSRKKQPDKKAPNVDVRKEIIQNMMESPKVPDKVSVEKQNIPPRDPTKFTVKGNTNFSAENAPPPDYRGPVNTEGTAIERELAARRRADAAARRRRPRPRQRPHRRYRRQISGGVLNGKATSLPKPRYPPAARAVRASGAVSVRFSSTRTATLSRLPR